MYMYYKATENTLCGAGILLIPFDPGLVSTDICSHGGRPWKKEQKNIHLKASPKGILPRYHYKLII